MTEFAEGPQCVENSKSMVQNNFYTTYKKYIENLSVTTVLPYEHDLTGIEEYYTGIGYIHPENQTNFFQMSISMFVKLAHFAGFETMMKLSHVNFKESYIDFSLYYPGKKIISKFVFDEPVTIYGLATKQMV